MNVAEDGIQRTGIYVTLITNFLQRRVKSSQQMVKRKFYSNCFLSPAKRHLYHCVQFKKPH